MDIGARPKRCAGPGGPLVFLQAVDECNTIDRSAAQRVLNVPNIHNTGHIHGVLPAHIGMQVRLAVKVNSTLGLVQEQRATIVDSFSRTRTGLGTTPAPRGNFSDLATCLQASGYR